MPVSSPNEQTRIEIGQIYPEVQGCIEEGELVEVLGRANGGKTTFMMQCMNQAIEKGMLPILLSSSRTCSQQYLQRFNRNRLMLFYFTRIADLAMTIHALCQRVL